jgi:hypothetical protein
MSPYEGLVYQDGVRRELAVVGDAHLWTNYAGAGPGFYAQWYMDMMRDELKRRGWL